LIGVSFDSIREERFLALTDLLDKLGVFLRSTRRQLGDERLQGELRVAHDGVTSLVAAVDVEDVHGALDDRLLVGVGHGVAEAVGEKARADREEQVALVQEVVGQRAADAHGQRMVFGEGALRLERRQHRHVRQLGELQELARGVGVIDTLADVEQRILRGEQRLHRGLHVVGVRTPLPALHGRVRMLVGVVLAEVARNDEQDRARPARSEMGEGPAHVVRDQLGAVDLAHPLGDGLERLGHVVMGVAGAPLAHALGDDEDRRRILPRLTDGAVGHLDPGGVQIGHDGAHADLLAARDARVRVGDRHRESLLAHHQDRHALFAEGVVDVVGGVAAHPRNTLGLERAREAVRRFDFHRSLLNLSSRSAVVMGAPSPARTRGGVN
jgi:hypothetical protein